MSDELTHIDAEGRTRMVDVGAKSKTRRLAIAGGEVRLGEKTMRLLSDAALPKGDALATAKIAGIMAAKRTADLIPLCHPLALTRVSVEFDWEIDGISVRATAATTGPTGVEMEALTGATVAALTVYDMCKALSHAIVLGPAKLVGKRGGKRDVGKVA